MKKICVCLLVLVMVIGIAGCTERENTESTNVNLKSTIVGNWEGIKYEDSTGELELTGNNMDLILSWDAYFSEDGSYHIDSYDIQIGEKDFDGTYSEEEGTITLEDGFACQILDKNQILLQYGDCKITFSRVS